jgi:hypothetical protein
MKKMDNTETCELQHCRLRTDILCEVQRREEKQDERFLALIEELRHDWKETKKEVSSIKDTMITGFITLIITIIGVFATYIFMNVIGFI